MRLTTTLLPMLLALLLASAACDDHDHDTAGTPTCEAIIARCHPLDTGSGPAHDCHEFAESRGQTEAMCVARRDDCFRSCVASDAGADAGLLGDVGGDGG
ncbi:MAG: hypothetical protein EPO40_25230 [Myxococcaceae bacterium]|nr:MAG: hypothetical protein EPO40_25230 [Myxococcaceae bacterium]